MAFGKQEPDLAAGEAAVLPAAHPAWGCWFRCCFLARRPLGWKNHFEIHVCKGCRSPVKLHLILFLQTPWVLQSRIFCIVQVMQSSFLQQMVTCCAFYRGGFVLSRKRLPRSLCWLLPWVVQQTFPKRSRRRGEGVRADRAHWGNQSDSPVSVGVGPWISWLRDSSCGSYSAKDVLAWRMRNFKCYIHYMQNQYVIQCRHYIYSILKWCFP